MWGTSTSFPPTEPAASAAVLASSVSRGMVKTIPGSTTPEVRGSSGSVCVNCVMGSSEDHCLSLYLQQPWVTDIPHRAPWGPFGAPVACSTALWRPLSRDDQSWQRAGRGDPSLALPRLRGQLKPKPAVSGQGDCGWSAI